MEFTLHYQPPLEFHGVSTKVISAGDIQTSSHDGNIPLGGTNYPPISAEPGIFTGFHDIYDALFEARHGRGPLDPAPVIGHEAISTPFGGIAPPLVRE